MDRDYSIGVATTLDEYDSIIMRSALYPLQLGLSIEKQQKLDTVYRGHADKNYSLLPSVFRNGNLREEDKNIRDFEKNNKALLKKCNSDFDKIATMQHYGMPTRFLDFTISHRQALYFACNKEKGKDGQVIIFRTNHIDSDSEEIKTLVAFAQLPFELKNVYDSLREEMNQILPDSALCRNLGKHYLVYPRISNERLRLQKGAFVVFGQRRSAVGSKEISSLFDRNMHVEGYFAYVDIPAHAKDLILLELEKIGIAHDTVYPEPFGDKVIR